MGRGGKVRSGNTDTEHLRVFLRSHPTYLSQVELEKEATRPKDPSSSLLSAWTLRVCGDLPHVLEGRALGSLHPALIPKCIFPEWKNMAPNQELGLGDKGICGLGELQV